MRGLSCFLAAGVFPNQGSNPCSLHWQVDSQLLDHCRIPFIFIISKEVFISLLSVDMKTAHSDVTSTSFPLCSNSKRKYVLLVSFQLLVSIHISLCLSTLCNHICRCLHCFDKTFFLFVLFSKFLNISTSLNNTIKRFYVNNSTIPMFLKHLGKCLVLSCLQFSSFNLIHKEF